MHRKTKCHRLLALLMALVMLLPVLPTAVFAEAGTEGETEQVTAEVEQPVEDGENTTDETPVIEEETGDGEMPPATETPIEEDISTEEEVLTEADTPIEEDVPVEEEIPTEEEASPEDGELSEEAPSEEETPQPSMDNTIESAIAANGHAYVRTVGTVTVYGVADLNEPIFTISQGDAVLLATEYVPRAASASTSARKPTRCV